MGTSILDGVLSKSIIDFNDIFIVEPNKNQRNILKKKGICVFKNIFEITKDKIIVAHNVDFDYRIIKNEFQKIKIKFQRDSLCTVDLSKLIFPDLKSYKLTNILSNFGIVNENPHRANSDALGALKLFKICLLYTSDAADE